MRFMISAVDFTQLSRVANGATAYTTPIDEIANYIIQVWTTNANYNVKLYILGSEVANLAVTNAYNGIAMSFTLAGGTDISCGAYNQFHVSKVPYAAS